MSSEDTLIHSDDPRHPANLICTLCKQFFYNNWCTGTGGGISIKDPETSHYYLAPSGVQKEQMRPEDLFVMDAQTLDYLRAPKLYKPSACTPLFVACYQKKDAGAIIHTHSQNAVVCSLIFGDEFRIANIEQIKAIPSGKVDPVTMKPIALSFFDTLRIPIIENMAHEDELIDDLHKTFIDYPNTCAVIVRRHGIFVWGPTIDKAKIFNEAIDYLMELAIKMHKLGIPSDCGIGEEKKHLAGP
ncbi:methylthioribulose 1-phosphate dehydratase MDE1 [Saccharomyces eubayanus]|uniref:methylthioribulose 1-phosphate dehydratase MDE1 n=1 Tax=Saccharomyces eubayanus TaxID=1080349 RepID=UPI0006C475ED|nr:MDE1-like protein [Saccharomyces eubayanus]KOG98614.1 MDE1-like protein [Saccharomyces eubayanus]